tara:strand:- start:1129 stop:1860 length:732 start_codon:yes stop_codon:yes gene_type:complete
MSFQVKADKQQKEVCIYELCDGIEKIDVVSNVKEKSDVEVIKNEGKKWVKKHILNSSMKSTEEGSLTFALWGSTPSKQSISIKFGKFGEDIFKRIVKISPGMKLLKCGVQVVNEKGKKKDIDLIWVDEEKKTLRYRELKGNIEMDTEKIPATIDKIKDEIFPYLKNKYPEYKDFEVDIGILAWGIYNRDGLKKGLSQIKKCEEKNVKVEHVEDFFKSVNFDWSKDDYNQYIRFLGSMIKDALL